MALNPIRGALNDAGLRAFQLGETPFHAEADAALAEFRGLRGELGRQVSRGDLTVKIARQQAAEAARTLRERLEKRSEGYSPVPRVFLDRLVSAHNARRKAREGMSLESLQKETNRLLRAALVEQQLKARAAEFEGRAFVRPMAGGPPVPTLGALLAFHETSSHAGDEAAQEWARRQLESMRNRALNPEDQERIDRACDRPDRFNPRIVSRYVETLQGFEPEAIEEFVDQAIEARDANACSAAFLLARDQPDGISIRWVRKVLDNLPSFPDAALEALRSSESEARAADADAASARADFTATLAETEARFSDLEAPTEGELRRRDRALARPLAAADQPIGLGLDRRGLTPEEYAEMGLGLEQAASLD